MTVASTDFFISPVALSLVSSLKPSDSKNGITCLELFQLILQAGPALTKPNKSGSTIFMNLERLLSSLYISTTKLSSLSLALSRASWSLTILAFHLSASRLTPQNSKYAVGRIALFSTSRASF